MGKKTPDNGKLYTCGICQKFFTVKSNLSRHIITFHQNKNNVTCGTCERTFHRKDSLIRHVRTHMKQKRHREIVDHNQNNECPICLLAFPSKHCLLLHTRTEHESIVNDGRRKEYFECSECSVRVTNKKDIKRHIYTVHSLDRQDKLDKKVSLLKCAECGKVFRYRTTIMDHYKEEHKIELEFKQLMFNTFDDFEKWRSPCYTMTNAWMTSVYNVKRYRCHRSGYYEDECKKMNRKRQRHLKIAGSKKIQGMCPSEITLRQRRPGGLCFVTQQRTHVGHLVDDLNELKHIYLKEDDKKNIVRLLKAGVPKETILRNMYCDYDPNDENYQQIETLPRIDDDNEFRLDREDLKILRPKVTKRLRRLRQRHTAVELYAEKEPFTVERIDEGIWQVGLFSAELQGVIEMYVVQKCDNKECTSLIDNCQLLCQPCQSCFHEYQCSCPDYSDSHNMCVHAHALCLYLLSQNQAIGDDIITVSINMAEVPWDLSGVPVPAPEISSESPHLPSKLTHSIKSDIHEMNFEENVHVALEVPSEPLLVLSKLTQSIKSDIHEMNFEENLPVALEISSESPQLPSELTQSIKNDNSKMNFAENANMALEIPSKIQKLPPKSTQSIKSDINEMNIQENVHNKIDDACHKLAEMLKSYIHPQDTQLYNRIEQQFLQPVEPTIQAMMGMIKN